jgi:hypothetical protein
LIRVLVFFNQLCKFNKIIKDVNIKNPETETGLPATAASNIINTSGCP